MSEKKQVKKRRIFDGEVIKLSSKNTIKVRVESKYPHPKYGRIIKHHTSYLVHSDREDVKVGDIVQIQECPPVSKAKRWELVSK